MVEVGKPIIVLGLNLDQDEQLEAKMGRYEGIRYSNANQNGNVRRLNTRYLIGIFELEPH